MSFLFDAAKKSLLDGDLDLLTDDIRCILIDEGTDTPSQSGDDFLDDILAGARIAVSGALTSKTTTAGVFDAADVTLTSVSGATVEGILIYKHTGTDSTSNLIAYIDSGTGLPLTPNGGDVTLRWDSGANKIFAL